MTELELVDFSVCFAVQDSVELAVLSSFVAIDQFFWFVNFILFAFIVNIKCLFYTYSSNVSRHSYFSVESGFSSF